MSAHKPEDWPHLFAQRLNAGDLEGAVSLYEPNASFVPKSGEIIVGRDGIRLVTLRTPEGLCCRSAG